MDTDTMTHNQTLGQAQEILLKKGREEGLYELGGQGNYKGTHKTINLDSRNSQILAQQSGSPHQTNLGHLHMFDSCVACCACGTSSSGSRACS